MTFIEYIAAAREAWLDRDETPPQTLKFSCNERGVMLGVGSWELPF